MAERFIERGPAAGGAPPGLVNLPGATAIYVDGATNELVVGTGTSGVATAPVSGVINKRFRVAIADVNAGFTLLPAVAGRKYRLIEAMAIAIGGAVAAVTTVDILGTQAASSVKLVSFAQANLTRSTVLATGLAGATVLADGASFMQNDANTPITVGITGSAATTATHIDIALTYALES